MIDNLFESMETYDNNKDYLHFSIDAYEFAKETNKTVANVKLKLHYQIEVDW